MFLSIQRHLPTKQDPLEPEMQGKRAVIYPLANASHPKHNNKEQFSRKYQPAKELGHGEDPGNTE